MQNERVVADKSQRARSPDSHASDQIASRFRSQSSHIHTRATTGVETTSANPSGGSTCGPSKELSAQIDSNKCSNETDATLSVTVRPVDIICGRGLHIMNRHGNLNLHLLASRYRQAYLRSTRRDKAAITRHIVQEIKSTGARFLRSLEKDRSDDDRWVEVDDKTAYKKVSHALRLRDHGKNFSKSIEIQEKGNSSTTTTPRSAAPTPVEARTAHPPQHYGIVNGFGLSPSPSLGMMGLGSFLQAENQLQSIPIHVQPRLDYTRPQPQPLMQGAMPRHDANWYNNVMLDSRLVAEAFGMTLAIMTQAANHNRSTFDGGMGTSQDSLGRNVAEEQRHGRG